VSAAEALARLGGVCRRKDLLKQVDRVLVDLALSSGEIVADARGRYALPTADEAMRTANRLSAPLSHLSAALAHGWAVKTPPERPHLTFSAHRKLTKAQRRGVAVHRAELTAAELDGSVTSVERTIVDCLRTLPFDEALAVADSALRTRSLTRARLLEIAAATVGPGSRAVRRVAMLASPSAANPFESVLRAIALDAGLAVEPQVPIGGATFLGRPDLADVGLRIVLEADSFEWHGDRQALRNDARRYNGFAAAGWLVLRFTWEDVMFQPQLVAEVLVAAADERRKAGICPRCSA